MRKCKSKKKKKEKTTSRTKIQPRVSSPTQVSKESAGRTDSKMFTSRNRYKCEKLVGQKILPKVSSSQFAESKVAKVSVVQKCEHNYI